MVAAENNVLNAFARTAPTSFRVFAATTIEPAQSIADNTAKASPSIFVTKFFEKNKV
jgi:hypothetical protein